MIPSNSPNRRQFLGSTLTVPLILKSSLLRSHSAPSNQITVGCIGMGSHGINRNLKHYLHQSDARVVSVCDVDRQRLQRAKTMVDEAYGDQGCHRTTDFREVLQRDDIDAVMISTPDHWHTLMSVEAMRAGKDVQCEKPTLTIDEGKILVSEARRLKKVFQTSTEDRALPEYHRMAELVRNGRIGKLQKIEVTLPKQPTTPGDPTPQPTPDHLDYEMWLGPAPEAPYTKDRVHFHFRWIWDYSGGIICDWGTHLFDTAQWANNTELSGPIEVEGTGTHWSGGLYDTVKEYDLTYRYANGVIMTCKPGNPSLRFVGDRGWVGNTGWRGKLEASSSQILNSKIGADEIKLYTNPEGEHRDFLDCVKSRKDPYFPVDIGHRVSTICHLGNIAIKLGRKLHWDPVKETFTKDKEANRWLRREMRTPWSLG